MKYSYSTTIKDNENIHSLREGVCLMSLRKRNRETKEFVAYDPICIKL